MQRAPRLEVGQGQWSFRRGFLLASSPVPPLVLLGFLGAPGPTGSAPLLATALSLIHLVGALLLGRHALVGRVLLSISTLGTGLLAALRVAGAPLGALGIFVGAVGLLAWIWEWTLPPPPRGSGPRSFVQGAAWAAGVVGLAGLYAELDQGLYAAACAGPIIAVLCGYRVGPTPGARGTMVLVAAGFALVALLLSAVPGAVMLLGVGVAIFTGIWAGRIGGGEGARAGKWSEIVYANPARTLVLTFLAVVVVGTALLALPFASTGGKVSLVDALFTSTSATCVTGLIVRDTPGDFSAFGQAVILALIQVGGLGIMIFSVAGMAITGKRPSLRLEAAAVEIVGIEDRSRMTDAARVVLAVTIVGEAVGALLLAGLFALAGDSPGQALWRGLFTAISAFCNAGFALQTDNLVGYQENVGVLVVVAALIVAGGLGPAVVHALPQVARGKKVALHARLVLWTTLLLLLPSFLFVLAVEWRNALSRLGAGAKLGNALFHAVTPRTAGFNSLEIGALRPATVWITMGLMFVGGSPASTAGGIKTTSLALLILMIHAALSGRSHIRVLGHRVPQHSVYKAAAIATLALLTVAAVVAVLQLTQPLSLSMAAFESLSALGTVGLSLGGTIRLDVVGKLLIVITMFAGRVGPLSMFMFLSAKTASDRFELPEADVAVG